MQKPQSPFAEMSDAELVVHARSHPGTDQGATTLEAMMRLRRSNEELSRRLIVLNRALVFLTVVVAIETLIFGVLGFIHSVPLPRP
jgi:hypothetical protein